MENPLLPRNHRLTEQVVRVPYRIEQHQEEKKQEVVDLPYEIPKAHDPLWNRRFWSVQHVHDCIEGKTFHWLWSPMAEVFNLSQIMFLLTPLMFYVNDRGAHMGIRGLVITVLSMRVLIVALKRLLEWYHDWRFKRISYRVITHP